MNIHRRWFLTFLAGCSLILVAASWNSFAPLTLGGQAAYVMINGNSMEPGFHTGDLAVVRPAMDYHLGDIVTYQDPALRKYVIHRIVGMDLDHFVLKGDNNSWTDSYHPARSEIVGKLWLFLPQAGKVVQWLRTPILLAPITGALGGILIAIMLESKRKEARKKTGWRTRFESLKHRFSRFWLNRPDRIFRSRDLHQSTPAEILPAPGHKQDALVNAFNPNATRGQGMIEPLFFVLGLLLLASIILGITAFTHSLSQTVPNDIKYQQTGAFSYSATAPASVYDLGTIISGQPVFFKLNCAVMLQFKYVLAGDQLQGFAGTHQLTARVVEDMSGWQRTVPLEAIAAFSSNAFTTTAPLNFCQLEDMVGAMEAATGLHAATYSLIIDPNVQIIGKGGGQGFHDTFNSPLVFQFNKTMAFVVRNDPAVDPLNQTKQGILASSLTVPATLPLFGFQAEVSIMRIVSLLGFCLSLAGLVALWLNISSALRGDAESYARMKFGSQLVDVHSGNLDLSDALIDVIALDDLAKLAEKHDAMILHVREGSLDSYFVQGDRITYRYPPMAGAGGGALASSLLRQEERDLRGAMDRGEFHVYYQPIVLLPDGRISAVEALLRWQHPQKGLISAGEFIQAAEETGMINSLGDWMLKVAIAQLKEWRDARMEVKLAVNLSESQLERDPAELILRPLERAGIDPQALQVETQESCIAKNASGVLSSLQKLRNVGIRISVDDFAGNLSLASLRQLSINGIKIDPAYMERIDNPERSSAVSTLLSEASGLGLEVVAKGVETAEQLGFLRGQSVQQAQGYLLGRPAPAEAITKLLYQVEGAAPAKPVKRRRKPKEGTP